MWFDLVFCFWKVFVCWVGSNSLRVQHAKVPKSNYQGSQELVTTWNDATQYLRRPCWRSFDCLGASYNLKNCSMTDYPSSEFQNLFLGKWFWQPLGNFYGGCLCWQGQTWTIGQVYVIYVYTYRYIYIWICSVIYRPGMSMYGRAGVCETCGRDAWLLRFA